MDAFFEHLNYENCFPKKLLSYSRWTICLEKHFLGRSWKEQVENDEIWKTP